MDFKKIRYLEKIAADGHKALEIKEYQDWELRFSKGYTGRANSIRIIGDPIEGINKDVEDKLQYAEKEYVKRGLPAMFKLTEADRFFSEYLVSRGYEVKQPTDVMVLPLGGADYLTKISDNIGDIVQSAIIVPGDINYSTTPDDWFESYFKFEEMTDKTKQDLCRQIHSNVSVDKVYIKI